MADLDFGVNFRLESFDDNFFDSQDQTLSDEEKSDQSVPGAIKNPFFVGMNPTLVNQMPDFDLYRNYKRALCICLKNGTNVSSSSTAPIYKRIMTAEIFQELSQYFTLVVVSIKLLKNKFHRQTALLLDRNILNHFNSSNIALEGNEIVIPLLELKEEVIPIYNSMYEPQYDISVLQKINTLYQYFDCNKISGLVLSRISHIVRDISESNYWSNPYNCEVNITEAFQQRKFRYKEPMSDKLKAIVTGRDNSPKNNDVRQVIDKLSNNNVQPKKSSYDLKNIANITRKDVYTDVASTNNTRKYKLYRIEELPSMTFDDVNSFFRSINDNRQLYNVFNTLLLSKTHCHLVINNEYVLSKMKPFFENKFAALYNYLFGYAWMCMYFEECIVKTRTLKTNRYIFTINTANKLPFFPYIHESIHLNPYAVLAVDDKVVKSKNNFNSVAMISDYNQYGIGTLSEFEEKFNVFTTGKTDKNIFNGLDTFEGTKRWKNFAISGSIMTACIPKRNPLMDQVTSTDMSYSDKLRRYFNEYYPEADIDMMCNSKSVFDFMDNVYKLINVLNKNLTEINGINTSVEVEPVKTLCVFVHTKYLEEMFSDMGDLTHIINNINSNSIKEQIHGEYHTLKRKNNTNNRRKFKEPFYEHFYHIMSLDDMTIKITSNEITKDTKPTESDSDSYVYLNDIVTDKVPEDQNILVMKISEGIKFKLRSSLMSHSIEVFRVHFEDFFSCVSRFHLPCVRSYYDGDNVYMLPSCITAMMTFTNIDYKYFAGIRDPIDILNKYRTRGFGTMVNDEEKGHIIEYNSSVEKWKKMTGVNKNNKATVDNHFKYKLLNDNIFKPNKFTNDYPDDSYGFVDRNYILTTQEYYKYFETKYGYVPGTIDLLKFHAINENGSVTPLKKWILEAAYDELE